jgi:hypothetical protein
MAMNIPTWRIFGRGRRLAAATVLLAACGGGDLLLLAVVTPLNGQWLDQTAGSTVALTFENLDPSDYLYASKMTADGALLNPSGVCAGDVDPLDGSLALSGTLDNGQLRMLVVQTGQVCIEGRFTDLRRLEAAVGSGSSRSTRVFINDRIDVRLTEGLWVSEGGGTVRIKFDNNVGDGTFNDSVDNGQTTPVGACDVSPGTTAVRMTGTMAGFGVGGITNPTIDALAIEGSGTVRFLQVVFEDGDTLSLRTAAGQAVTLKRQKEATPTTCP